MKLHSPDFEDRLVNDVRTRLRALGDQQKQPRHMKRQRLFSWAWGFFNLFTIVIMGMQLHVYRHEAQFPLICQVLLSLWLLALSLLHTGRIWNCLYASPDLRPLVNLPASDAHIYRWESWRSLRYTLWMPIYAVLGMLAAGPEESRLPLLLLGAVVSWCCGTAMAWVCMAYLPQSWTIYGGLGLFAMLFATTFGVAKVQLQILTGMIQSTGSFALWLPTGWGVRLAAYDGQTLPVILLALVGVGTAAFVALARAAWRKTGQNYLLLPELPNPPETIQPASAADSSEPVPPSVIDVQLRQEPPQTFWTKLYWWWLSPPEKGAVTSAAINGLGWEAAWWKGLKAVASLAIIIWVLKGFLPALTRPAIIYGGMMVALMILPWGAEFGALFTDRRQGPLTTVLHGVLPVTAPPLLRAMVKAAVMRLVMAAPLLWLAGSIYVYSDKAATASPDVLIKGWVWGTKVGLIALAAQPLIAISWFLRGGRLSFRIPMNLLLACFSGVVLLICFFSAFLLLLAESFVWCLAGFTTMLVTGFIVMAIFQRVYHRGKLDLIRQPSS